MLAKIIAHGPSRDEAVRRLAGALERLGVAGVTTNRDLLLAVLRHPAFAAGEIDTHFIDRNLPPETRVAPRNAAVERIHAMVAALHEQEVRRRAGGPLPPSIPSGWRNSRWRPQSVTYRIGDEPLEVRYVAEPGARFAVEAGGQRSTAVLHGADARGVAVEVDGVRRRFTVVASGDVVAVHGPLGTTELIRVPRFPAAQRDDTAGGFVAPRTDAVRAVNVAAGDRVTKGQVLLVLEAMKMEHEMVAQADGVVREVRVEVGQMVDPDAVLVVMAATET
jgi:propionyl-CoA carboxylase alpha chain